MKHVSEATSFVARYYAFGSFALLCNPNKERFWRKLLGRPRRLVTLLVDNHVFSLVNVDSKLEDCRLRLSLFV